MKTLLLSIILLATCQSADAQSTPEALHEQLHAAAAPDAGPVTATPAPTTPEKPAIANPEMDPLGTGKQIVDAAKAKDWPLFTMLCIVAVIAVVRRYGSKVVPWFATDRGGATLVLLAGMGTAFAEAAAAGRVTWSTLAAGLGMTFMSAGAWAWAKKMAKPRDAAPAGGK
jgi:hypothetical protein